VKVVLVTPNFHQARGNTITVQRIVNKLSKLMVETEVVSIKEDSTIKALPPADIYHGFNAYRFYKFIEKLDKKIDPFLVTFTGTDLNHDLFHKKKRADVIESVTKAKAVHVFNEAAKELLLREIPIISGKIFVIPQDTSPFEDMDFPFKKEENTFMFVLPAGIRKVKNVPFAISALKVLHDSFPWIRLTIVGPILEENEGLRVQKLIEMNKDWVKYIGEVPYRMMGVFYNQADVVLNTSISEGQSTAIMEGMAAGHPVLVSANQGNLSLVTHGKNGLTFHNQSDFLQYAEKLVLDPGLRESLGASAKRYIKKHHENSLEAEALLRIYQHMITETKEMASIRNPV
jgi:glycosyltransferase involved in cell wall biosynthesis